MNTEEPAQRLRSGTARVSRNCTLEGTYLSGRAGFDLFDGNNSSAVLSMTQWNEDSGDIYMLLKCIDGNLYYAKVYDDASGQASIAGWTTMLDAWSGHNVDDPGDWFTDSNRIHYVDRVGVTKWHPTTSYKPDSTLAGSFVNGGAAKSWKGGIQQTIGATIVAAANGNKHGYYRAAVVGLNSVTEEVSCIQDLQAASVYTSPTNSTGGLSVAATPWKALAHENNTAAMAYEWDQVLVLSSRGQQKKMGDGTPDYTLFPETEIARTGLTAGFGKGDHLLVRTQKFTNSGGTPPGARHAAFNGTQCLYAGIYSGANPVYGQVMFSLRGFPCMVPGDQTYGPTESDTYIWKAEPWDGIVNAVVAGAVRCVGYVGQKFIVFTDTGSFWCVPTPGTGGKLGVIESGVVGGCLSDFGGVQAGQSVHAIGRNCWMLADSGGVTNIANLQFTPTLEAIPNDQRTKTAGGYFGHRDEVWMAVARENWSINTADRQDGSAFIVCNDDTSLSDIDATGDEAGYAYHFQVLPDAPADGDGITFMYSAFPTTISVQVNRPAGYSQDEVMEWVYWDGAAWADITITKDTTNPNTQDGTKPFVDDGSITLTDPGDATTTTINGHTGYAVRCRAATGKSGAISQVPVLTPDGPSRLLIYDRSRKALTGMYDPRNLCGSYITSLCEYVTPAAGPKMLLGLSDGRILSWPSSNAYDTDADGTYGYSCRWTGYVGCEKRYADHKITRGVVCMGDNSGGVEIGIAGLQCSEDTITPTYREFSLANSGDAGNAVWGKRQVGRVFLLDIKSDADVSPDWEVVDIFVTLERVEK